MGKSTYFLFLLYLVFCSGIYWLMEAWLGREGWLVGWEGWWGERGGGCRWPVLSCISWKWSIRSRCIEERNPHTCKKHHSIMRSFFFESGLEYRPRVLYHKPPNPLETTTISFLFLPFVGYFNLPGSGSSEFRIHTDLMRIRIYHVVIIAQIQRIDDQE